MPTRLHGDDLGGILPHVSMGMGGVALQVPADRADEARQILTEVVILDDLDELSAGEPPPT